MEKLLQPSPTIQFAQEVIDREARRHRIIKGRGFFVALGSLAAMTVLLASDTESLQLAQRMFEQMAPVVGSLEIESSFAKLVERTESMMPLLLLIDVKAAADLYFGGRRLLGLRRSFETAVAASLPD